MSPKRTDIFKQLVLPVKEPKTESPVRADVPT